MHMVDESMTCLHTYISKNWVTVKSGKIMHNHLFINVDTCRFIQRNVKLSPCTHGYCYGLKEWITFKYMTQHSWYASKIFINQISVHDDLNDKKIKKPYFASLARVHSVMKPWRLLPTHSTGREEGGGGCGLLGRIRAGLGGVHSTVSSGLGHHYIISTATAWPFQSLFPLLGRWSDFRWRSLRSKVHVFFRVWCIAAGKVVPILSTVHSFFWWQIKMNFDKCTYSWSKQN